MKLIDKDAALAEIEKRKSRICGDDLYSEMKRGLYNSLIIYINTLEVKEVDLQSEIDRVWDNSSDNFLEDGWKEFEDIAKHFFELGLKVQKGE